MTDVNGLYRAHVSTLIDRTRLALETSGYERLVIHAGDLVLKSRFDDLEHVFRPVPAFAHWTPWAWPGSALLIEKGRSARLLARRRTDFWEKLEAPHAEMVRSALDVEEVDDLASLRDVAARPRVAFVGESSAEAVKLGFDEDRINPHRLLEALDETRVLKTPYEIDALVQASRRGVKGHLAIREAFDAGERSELALHLHYLSASGQDDADTPYKNIVALGEAAAVLHHHHYGTRPEARTLLVDAGAQTRGYASDITRTYVVAGDDSAFPPLLEAMERLQKSVVARIEVGKNYERLHDECHELLGGLLVEQGLVRCSAEAAVADGITRVFFPHGLGHSLGIQVHDVGCRKTAPRSDNAWLRNTSSIQTGQVFTVEPGLYFIDALLETLRNEPAGDAVVWDRVDPLRPYGGIRIEDDVLVLDESAATAVRNLTREAFAQA